MAFVSQPIPKDPVLPPGQDFAYLRQQGLHLLEQLSGRTWTDYNLHDPGVTLLEALCYALTDLSNRASQPMPTLLAPAPGAPPAAASLLVPPNQAFANHPATLADYKKLVLDEFHTQLKNAWVSPLPNDAEGQPAPPGHYQVQLELLPPAAGPPGPLPAEQVEAQVLAFLNCHRQLGEVFVSARVLRPQPLAVGLQLELAPGQAPEEVLAQVLWEIAIYLDPYLRAPTLVRLQAGHVAVEDMFAGPVARYRLLQEASFASLRQRVTATKLVKKAAQVAGLHYVASVRLYQPGSPTPTEEITRHDHEVLTLDLEGSLAHLAPTRRQRPLSFDAARVRREFYRLLHQNNLSVQHALRPDQLRLLDPLATADYHELGRYDSVQHLLPTLYGTQEAGPPPGSSGLQQAAIMQLKGYLLLCEQVLADFCAQLENTARFFSPVPQPATYYSGLLYEVPHVAPLMPGTGISPAQTWGNDAAAASRWQQYQQNPANEYRQALRQLAEPPGDWQRRRQQFLLHLLARFGYSVAPHQATQAGAAPAELDTIRTCERLLHHLNAATYARAAARLDLPTPTGPGQPPAYAEAGLEFFLFLLTGLESLPRKWGRQQSLAALEVQVQLAGGPAGEGTRLVVRGRQLAFVEWVAVLRTQLAAPALEAISATAVRLGPAGGGEALEVELFFEEDILVEDEYIEEPPPGLPDDALVNRLLRHLHGLEARLARFSLLDHLVLKPRRLLAEVARGEYAADQDFYHCQATLLLPGYSRRFHYDHHGPAAQRRAAGNHRRAIEELTRQYAPAHVRVNIVWLDYEAMRRWEAVYAPLAAASDLLNATGHADEAALEPAQQQARAFLSEHLSPAAP